MTHLDTSDIYGPFTNEVLVGARLERGQCLQLCVDAQDSMAYNALLMQ